ncbi:uncharacterized protein BP01DRAFT_160976 [Aspergillus saccharolyticus JOP 1030-1]|uniref:Subtelomeric hrmA-associated cluster protein AFUB-079030/YDR124W-like helical bundle domain-containing protein n=1 Tax=Aspergillus saccharolyticus JOP 1030-1 TaxID=1450539 RepID=A0A318ZDW9_9EURO|nr:hypothetical protein BP01DRAFT_160976 [Aspergillus saccharolyticus JOP 1030-1]PYH41730.1 hypothetical protein BP01DRAFT_160976 [Aspergillus saccharolyticus JOP 1030-1]
MVYTPATPSGSGPTKRSASSLHDGALGWETAPIMNAPLQATVNMPFNHYSLIYLDHMGRLQVQESPSISEQNMTIFTHDVREKFLEILGSQIGYRQPLIRRTSNVSPAALSHDRMSEKYRRSGKRRKTQSVASSTLRYSNPYTNTVQEMPPVATVNRVAIQIGDSAKLLQYYRIALDHVQQQNCRHVAKAFIKYIEPRKQVRHPYNGGRPRPGAPPGTRGDPELTKPAWWPANVTHKEPDHLKKKERLELLLHIIRNLGQHGITPEDLQDVAHDCRRQIPQERMLILDEIFRVRKMEVRYEMGEVDATTIVYVQERHDKGEKDEDNEEEGEPVPEPVQKIEPEEAECNEAIHSTATSMEALSAPFTAIDPASVSSHRAISLGADRDQLFPLPESLSYGEPSQLQKGSFYSTSVDYNDEYTSPTVINTPAGSEMPSPIEQTSSFECLTPAPITAPAGSEHHRPTTMSMQQAVGAYDSWATPTYRPQPMYSSFDYSTVATTQAMAQPTIHYQMPMNEMHGLPELANPAKMSFRTGSLSHPSLHQSAEQL